MRLARVAAAKEAERVRQELLALQVIYALHMNHIRKSLETPRKKTCSFSNQRIKFLQAEKEEQLRSNSLASAGRALLALALAGGSGSSGLQGHHVLVAAGGMEGEDPALELAMRVALEHAVSLIYVLYACYIRVIRACGDGDDAISVSVYYVFQYACSTPHVHLYR